MNLILTRIPGIENSRYALEGAVAGEGEERVEGGEEKRDGDWGGAATARGRVPEGRRGGMVRNKEEAEAGVVMVAMVVGVEPGASREEFEEWSDPGGKSEIGEEGADWSHY